MPRLRQQRPEFDSVSRLLKGYGANAASIARSLKCAPATASKKLNDPRYFTLGDLVKLSFAYGIPFEEVRGAIVK